MRRSKDAYTIKGDEAKKIMKEIKEPATQAQKKTLLHAMQNRLPREGYEK